MVWKPWKRDEADASGGPRSGARGRGEAPEKGASPEPGAEREPGTGEEDGAVRVVVEIPKGSRNKYEYDPRVGRFVLDRMLFSSMHYPADYGYIPGTSARDGDPVDALVLVGESTFPGCMIEARPIGLFQMRDEKGPDEKILCVPVSDPQWNWITSLDEVPAHLLREITHFFEVYKELEGKETEVGGWRGREEAWREIREGRQRAEEVPEEESGEV